MASFSARTAARNGSSTLVLPRSVNPVLIALLHLRSPVIDHLAWLAIDVAVLEEARPFYERILNLEPIEEVVSGERHFRAGDSNLHLRGPDAESQGGAHVHYAFETGAAALDEWEDRLSEAGPVDSHNFGVYRSLYVFDPDDHCVELGGRADGTKDITGIFEIVLEVEMLEAAEAFYHELGCSVIDRGEDRKRVRLDAGPFELELWEPQTGLAGAEPGSHVELGLGVRDPAQAVDRAATSGATLDGSRESAVIDPDGHRLVFVSH